MTLKKIICILLTLSLIQFFAVPACAVTPVLKIPDMPQISGIQLNVKLDKMVYESAVEKWLEEHLIRINLGVLNNK